MCIALTPESAAGSIGVAIETILPPGRTRGAGAAAYVGLGGTSLSRMSTGPSSAAPTGPAVWSIAWSAPAYVASCVTKPPTPPPAPLTSTR